MSDLTTIPQVSTEGKFLFIVSLLFIFAIVTIIKAVATLAIADDFINCSC